LLALPLLACATVVTSGGAETTGGAGPGGSVGAGVVTSGDDGAPQEVMAGWEDLHGLDCAGIDPQLWSEVMGGHLVVTCADGHEGVLEGTVDVRYEPFCTSGPVQNTIASAELDVYDPIQKVPLTFTNLLTPVLQPGEAVTTTYSIQPVSLGWICEQCDQPVRVTVAWRIMPPAISGAQAEVTMVCTP
jgi:hypothetical protein